MERAGEGEEWVAGRGKEKEGRRECVMSVSCILHPRRRYPSGAVPDLCEHSILGAAICRGDVSEAGTSTELFHVPLSEAARAGPDV